MIIGVTHDQDGRVIQRLSVSTKVSIGLPPNGDCNHPTKLDHFVFLRKKKSANRVGWEVDPELTEHYGDECRELHIMLIDDDIENVFPSSYAWWTATERKCWGDGTSATRRTAEDIRRRLQKSPWADPVRSDPVLHVGDDLALEPDGQHHRDEEHPERDEDLDSDDDHRAEVNPVGKKRIWHQITFSTSSPTTLTEQSMSAEAPVS